MTRRSLDKLPPRRLPLDKILLVAFVLFIAYRIITPKTITLAKTTAPDGTGTAELRKIYYTSQPSYKIYFRPDGALLPRNLLSLSAYTNVAHQTAIETLEWSSGSRYLIFKINDQPIWQYDVQMDRESPAE